MFSPNVHMLVRCVFFLGLIIEIKMYLYFYGLHALDALDATSVNRCYVGRFIRQPYCLVAWSHFFLNK